MRTVFELGDGLTLAVTQPSGAGERPDPGGGPYPTSGLQKGLLLLETGQELSSEGVGFGVPVLKRGPRAVFPGSAELIVRPGTPHTMASSSLQFQVRECTAGPPAPPSARAAKT